MLVNANSNEILYAIIVLANKLPSGNDDLILFGQGTLDVCFGEVVCEALEINVCAVEGYIHCLLNADVALACCAGSRQRVFNGFYALGQYDEFVLFSFAAAFACLNSYYDAVDLRVACDGDNNRLCAARPDGIFEFAAVGSIVSVPLSVVAEVNRGDDRTFGSGEGESAAINAQLRAVLGAPDAVGRGGACILRRDGQRDAAFGE